MVSLLFFAIFTIHLLDLKTKAFTVFSFSRGGKSAVSILVPERFKVERRINFRKGVWVLSSRPSETVDSLLSESAMERLLEDVLYSGDVEAVSRRNPRTFLHPKFYSFLKEKLNTFGDDDERTVVQNVLGMIEGQIQLSDGMGQDSDLLYERRLDKIVFANPSERSQVLKELQDELSPGFISFLQSEMKSSKDLDVKVVIAEILHEISVMKGGEYLDSTDKKLLTKESEINNTQDLQEVSDQLQRLSKLGDRNEQILAGLLFSNNDIVEDIFNNLHLLDSEFQSFLQKKIQSTSNLEERNALTSLMQSIKQVSAKIQELENERLLENVDQGEDLSFDAVKERMRAVQAGPSGSSKGFAKTEDIRQEDPFSVKATKKETFWSIVQRFEETVSRSAGNLTLIDVIKSNYALCDYEFIQMLESESSTARDEGNVELSRRLLDMRRGINEVMVAEMEIAQEKLANILSKRDPKAIDAEMVRMARRGEVNEALILLIEGNIQTAKQENAQGAVQLLSKLLQRIAEEKERKMPEQQRLLRHLMQLSSSDKRKEALYNAFRPSKKLNDRTGEFETNGPPEVAPPVFIDVVRRFITEFGNVDSFNLMNLANQIIDEAQEVATDLYGPGMTPQEQQRMMFEKNTVSVWDLANLEEQSMLSGEEVPWSNDSYDDKEVEDVLGERVRKIGGAEADF